MTQQWTEVVAAGVTRLYWVFWTEALATLAIGLHLSNDVRLHGHLGNQQKTWAKIAKEGLVFSESGRATWRYTAGIITKVIHALNWQPSIIDVLEWYKEEDRDESKKAGTDGGRNYITTWKKITSGKTVQIIQKIILLYNNEWFRDAPLINIKCRMASYTQVCVCVCVCCAMFMIRQSCSALTRRALVLKLHLV